ncbi:LysR substrate-binding domain-containing protein [Streptomyces lydicus]|uniref:LysR substrate-binding domain-containing protein n=1 Tax=Streptomyces lydicus TaxID=47763 RepID=UPI0036BB575E
MQAEPEAALRALSGRPWVMEPAGTPSRRWATAVCRQAGFERDVRLESPDLLVQLLLVGQGHAAALLPDLLWGGSGPTIPRGCRCRTVAAPGGSSRPYGTAAKATRRPGPAVRRCDGPSQHMPATCPERLAGPVCRLPRNR